MIIAFVLCFIGLDPTDHHCEIISDTLVVCEAVGQMTLLESNGPPGPIAYTCVAAMAKSEWVQLINGEPNPDYL